jgi:hypothetical protein
MTRIERKGKFLKRGEVEKLTGIHPECADSRCFETLNFGATEVAPARRQKLSVFDFLGGKKLMSRIAKVSDRTEDFALSNTLIPV